MIENILYLDLETRSSVDLENYGLKKYVASPDFKILLIAWALNNGPVQVSTIDDLPTKLKDALNSDCKVVMHNSIFDATALRYAGIANIRYDRIIDTMIQAHAHALPPALDSLSKLYNLQDLGKRDGTALINLFCKPSKNGLKQEKGVVFNSPQDYPDKWQSFVEYAHKDVESMRVLYKLMPRDNYPDGCELQNYHENLRVNCTGLPLDTDFIDSAVELYENALLNLNKKFRNLTGFNITQNAVFLKYLKDKGLAIENVRSKTLKELLKSEDLDNDLKYLIRLRLESSQATPKKYIALKNRSYNGRIYHTLQFMGGSRTGRDAGKGFQPQNLKRPSLFLSCKTDEEEDRAVERTVEKIKSKDIQDNEIDTLSELIRNVIKPEQPDYKIVVSDLSNIEGRTLAWLAGEEWKVQLFRDFDAKKIKYDNYIMAYSKAMQVNPEEVTKAHRAIGKVMELSMGYGGAVAPFLSFSKDYNLDISELYKNVFAGITNHLDKELFFDSDYGYKPDYNISKNEYRTCQYLKTKWRAAHPNIVKFWRDLGVYFRKAVENPNKVYKLGKLSFIYEKDFLKIILPSSRKLMYYKPTVNLEFITPSNTKDKVVKTRTHGGTLSENVASAVARDVLYSNLINIRKYGYNIISLVHDEIVTECPKEDKYSAANLSNFLKQPPAWALGLPLDAAGFESNRYKGK